jgi:hypothetical protein
MKSLRGEPRRRAGLIVQVVVRQIREAGNFAGRSWLAENEAVTFLDDRSFFPDREEQTYELRRPALKNAEMICRSYSWDKQKIMKREV